MRCLPVLSILLVLLGTATVAFAVGDDRPPIDHAAIRAERINTLLPQILREQGLDMWLVFSRENAEDPLLPEIGVPHIVARGAFLFSLKEGQCRKIAIAASYDTTPIENSGLYDEVISYRNEGVKPHLQEWLHKLDPQKIAVDFSRDVPSADGLTHGMYLYLNEVLGDAYAARFVSAERLVVSLIGKKLPMEIDALRTAVLTTQQIIDEGLTADVVRAAATTEKDLGQFLSRRAKELGTEVAFMSVVGGPVRGHSSPTDRLIQPGDLIRIDFGVRYQGYAADIQRTAYVLKPGEITVPAGIQRLWDVARRATDACVETMKPGVTGNQIDSVGRGTLEAAGFGGYPHAAGHAIGRKVHDIGAILGPDWPERYGRTVFFPLEENQVYAVEPILYAKDPRTGEEINIGIEEDVVVTSEGALYIGEPQRELIVIR